MVYRCGGDAGYGAGRLFVRSREGRFLWFLRWGSRNLLAGTAITQTVIADLSSHLHGGLPTYRGVADDAALTVSAGGVALCGGGEGGRFGFDGDDGAERLFGRRACECDGEDGG